MTLQILELIDELSDRKALNNKEKKEEDIVKKDI